MYKTTNLVPKGSSTKEESPNMCGIGVSAASPLRTVNSVQREELLSPSRALLHKFWPVTSLFMWLEFPPESCTGTLSPGFPLSQLLSNTNKTKSCLFWLHEMVKEKRWWETKRLPKKRVKMLRWKHKNKTFHSEIMMNHETFKDDLFPARGSLLQATRLGTVKLEFEYLPSLILPLF